MVLNFENSSVKEIFGCDFVNNSLNFKNARCCFVLFYADWCRFCNDMKPDYISFANKAQFFKCYAVNIDKNKEFVSRIKETSSPKLRPETWPTLIVYKKGIPVEKYTGERTVDEFLKKAIKTCPASCNCQKN